VISFDLSVPQGSEFRRDRYGTQKHGARRHWTIGRRTTGIAFCCARHERPHRRSADQCDELAIQSIELHSVTAAGRGRISNWQTPVSGYGDVGREAA